MRIFRLCLATLATLAGLAAAEPRILHVESYHEGYAWSDGIVAGITHIVGDRAEFKVLRLDTKRNTSPEFMAAAGDKAKALIDEWKPDVVIASDDNAARHLIVKHLKNTATPVVFCGLNWDASIYGLPCENVTGMVEVTLLKPLLGHMRKFAKGDRLGFIGPDIVTAHKELENCVKTFKLEGVTSYFAKDFADFQKGFVEVQKQCDMLIIDSHGGLYDDAEMKNFCLANTTIPTGSGYDFMAPCALFAMAKSAEEQGEWAAGAALRILDGTKPADIPVVENRRGTLFVNMPIAKALKLTIPLPLLKAATIIK